MISGVAGLATVNILDNAGSPEWLSMVAGLGVSFAGGYYGNKITGIGTVKESGEIKSFADLMSPEDAARYNGYFDEVLNSAVNKADDALNSINKWVYKKVYDLSDGLGLIPEPVGVGKIPYEAPENIKPVENLISKMSGYKGVSNPVESNYVLFNKTHKGSAPVPKGTGPNGGRLQSHHGLQQQWAKENLSKYGYDADLAPTVTIETGKGMPHTSLSNAQNARRNARVASGNGKWSSGLQDELGYMVDDFTNAGFSKDTINGVLEQQYKMLDKLKVPYERIDIK